MAKRPRRKPVRLGLAEKLKDKEYRDAYMAAHVRMGIGYQIRQIRGSESQAAFAARVGKNQSVISRLENADYGRYTVKTLLEIAQALDIGLVVRFVDYPTFLKATHEFLEAASHVPKPYTVTYARERHDKRS